MQGNNNNDLKKKNLISEAVFSASRSSGPGGQNVNKVNTKIELRFNIHNSILLNDREKAILKTVLKNHLTANGELIVVSQVGRSQLQNKEKAIEKFYLIIAKALSPRKRRITTKPTTGSVMKRLEKKRIHAAKKYLRNKNFDQ